MKIKLDLSRHCIETELKKIHNLLISDYFKSKGENDILEQKIEQIGHALTTLDFSKLRSHFPELSGHTDEFIALSTDEDGQIHIHTNDQTIIVTAELKKP